MHTDIQNVNTYCMVPPGMLHERWKERTDINRYILCYTVQNIFTVTHACSSALLRAEYKEHVTVIVQSLCNRKLKLNKQNHKKRDIFILVYFICHIF